MGSVIKLTIFAIIFGCAANVASAQNYKIKQSTSISGQSIQSTVYVKGSRKRTESGGMMGVGANVATLEQCDLKRTVQVNDKKKIYFVQAAAGGETGAAQSKPSVSNGKTTKGGTITQTSSITDTGERKQMFGLTARHIKTVMTMVSSPDACSPQNTRIETDGWYVDLPLFSCPFDTTRDPMAGAHQPSRAGCQDRIVVRATGAGKLGFALQLTQKMGSGDDDEGFSSTLETLEFSKATLDDALFNVPSNYTLANSQQDLYGRPDLSTMTYGRGNGDDDDAPARSPSMSTPAVKKAGVKRIGVLVPTNRSGEILSTTDLQRYLVQQLTVGKVDAVAVNSESDAKALGCDLILSSDVSKMKQSTAGKIGGIFGKVTSTDTGGKFDAQVDFKLVSLSGGQAVLQSKAAAKVETDAGRAAEGVLAQEASAVLAVAK